MTQQAKQTVQLFRAEKIAEVEGRATRQCHGCGRSLTLIRTLLDADTGEMIHMFECECGERVWDD